MARLMRETLEEAIKATISRFERNVQALMECPHHLVADGCADCKGLTSFGPIDEVRQVLVEKGIIKIEVVGSASKKKGLAEFLAYGVGYVSGATSWIGGKLVHQVARKRE